ncbi:MAG TPA: GntR family transcriptional regulator [Candidatus Hydrogenedentes bacterium]|nr:GntR family transcriptional regulator [Candidatus Hydrogenedentota bacterium]
MSRQAPKDSHSTPTASRAVTARLVRNILEGVYGAGSRLPTERELAEQFNVSRHVVREALKRLEALGLVRIVQGSGVYAQDVLLTGGLELFEYLLFGERNDVNQRILDEFLAFWALFVPDVLRLAARHRTREQVQDLREALRERAAALEDLPCLTQVHLRMLRTVAQAAHNTVYQLIFNNAGRVMARLRAAVPLARFSPIITQEELAHLVAAIEQQDEELAALLAQRLTERARASVASFVQFLLQSGSELLTPAHEG